MGPFSEEDGLGLGLGFVQCYLLPLKTRTWAKSQLDTSGSENESKSESESEGEGESESKSEILWAFPCEKHVITLYIINLAYLKASSLLNVREISYYIYNFVLLYRYYFIFLFN